MQFDYARVSAIEQHTQQQESALKDNACVRVFVDQGVSGAVAERPELNRLLDDLREDDVVVVRKLIDSVDRSETY